MAEYTEEADWSIIPQHCRDGLKLYIERGIPPGSFLEAVVSNDLREACGRADHINRYRIFDYVSFLSQYAPFVAWGSPERYHSWIRKGGWIGVHDGGESCLD